MANSRNKEPRKPSAPGVLRRYKKEGLPAFVGMSLKNVNQAGIFGEHPLDVACVRGIMEEIEALVEAGADVNAKGELGNTPLHEAIGQNHVRVVEFLLSRGASREAKSDFGDTPADLARKLGAADSLKLLI
ncbi:MAG TPA: ankyrin repeat domain-containing protein [Candidatus Acidoferrales bacterium]|nr:ankyrin repeat domain-containing protein [Candidatus Acidoferrales bacterium]